MTIVTWTDAETGEVLVEDHPESIDHTPVIVLDVVVSTDAAQPVPDTTVAITYRRAGTSPAPSAPMP